MNRKIKKELKAFKEFKKNFNFIQKEIIQDGENFYCEGELLKEGDITYALSDKWLNVGYKAKEPYAKVLSNLFPYEFKFRGKKLNSIEGFFQGIKFKNKKSQILLLRYSGIDSNKIKVVNEYDWRKTGILYWQGKEIKRDSAEYNDLVDELYISAIQNPLYRSALKNCDKEVIHSIGADSKNETVFTRYEFEYQINCLINYLKSNEKSCNNN